jgi:hypothetical protein
MGRKHEGEAVTYFVEFPGKWPRSRPRIMEVIGWTIAQANIDDPSKEVFYSGGGKGLFNVEDAEATVGELYNGVVPKFVHNCHYGAVFKRRDKAEEVAMLLAVEHPELMGRLYLNGATRLGVLRKETILCQKPRSG